MADWQKRRFDKVVWCLWGKKERQRLLISSDKIGFTNQHEVEVLETSKAGRLKLLFPNCESFWQIPGEDFVLIEELEKRRSAVR